MSVANIPILSELLVPAGWLHPPQVCSSFPPLLNQAENLIEKGRVIPWILVNVAKQVRKLKRPLLSSVPAEFLVGQFFVCK